MRTRKRRLASFAGKAGLKTRLYLSLLMMLALAAVCGAQNADALAKQTQNPVASLIGDRGSGIRDRGSGIGIRRALDPWSLIPDPLITAPR